MAPLLIQGRMPAQLAGQALMLDQGTAVDGVVVDAAGAPITGVRVGLRAGALPSTLGQSAADGSFTLRTRPGTYGATVVPGSARPGWELAVPGVVIPAGATRVAVRLGAVPTARIGLSMTGAGAGSKLLIETDAVPAAATVEVTQPGVTPASPPVTLAASARIRLEITVGAGGAVSLPDLPRAKYRATLFAASAAAPASITVKVIDATGGDIDAPMTIAPPVTISGMLGSAAANARVLAIDEEARLALAPLAAGTFFAAVGAEGLFSLNVNPSRSYRVTVEPPPGGAFARKLIAPVTVAAAPYTLPVTLEPGLWWGGRVVADPQGQPQPDVTVSAHCVAGNDGCVDPGRPIAEAITASDGTFHLILPDPGVMP
jgi:hypothetical protein